MASFSQIGLAFYGQLTLVKIKYPLTSIKWPYCEIKFRAHRGHGLFFELPANQVPALRLDQGDYTMLNFCTQGRKVNRLTLLGTGYDVSPGGGLWLRITVKTESPKRGSLIIACSCRLSGRLFGTSWKVTLQFSSTGWLAVGMSTDISHRVVSRTTEFNRL